jgi:hypothetical protein
MTLYFFRTPGGSYFVASYKPSAGNFAMLDCGYIQGSEMVFGKRKPRGMQSLNHGECVPVTLAVTGKSNRKPKRARKGG